MQILDPDECDKLVDSVLSLRSHWITKGGDPASFFTLGAASYLEDLDDYKLNAQTLNPVLLKNFDWLFERVKESLMRQFRSPVALSDQLAYPGFHIWDTPGIFDKPVASTHFDLQYDRVWERDDKTDFQHPVSFTLPIRLPARGGGLNLWEVSYDRYLNFYNATNPKMQPSDIARLIDPIRYPYSIGALTVHSGLYLHQIAPVDKITPGDMRITLQGHGLFSEGEWKLYW